MTIPLALAVARRALVVAVVAVLVAIAALVAALVSGSDGDPTAASADSQAQDDLTAAAERVTEAAALAEAAAARAEETVAAASVAAASAEQAAVTAQEAATQAQEAAGMAFQASVEADMAANNATADDTPGDAENQTGTDDPGGTSADDAVSSEPESDDTQGAATPDPGSEGTDTPDTDTPDTGTENDEPDSTTEDPSGQAPQDPVVDLPGEAYEFGPPAGAGLAVVGVSHNSFLNVRDVPNGQIVARLDNVINVGSEPVVYARRPDSDALIATLDLNRGVIATGNTRQLPTTIWYEIRMGEAFGWSSSSFLAPLGATTDSTAQIVAVMGDTPTAPSLEELGLVVAAAAGSDDPPSRIVVSGAPVLGDLAEVTLDVLGLPDDSVRGYRLQVFAQQDPDSGAFVLKTVESTTICDSHRGVSEEGLCN